MKIRLYLQIAGLLLILSGVIDYQESIAQDETAPVKIESLADMKEAFTPATLFQALQTMDTWMPKIVSSTNWRTQLSKNIVLNYYIDHNDDHDVIFDDFLAESDTIIKELEMFFEMTSHSKGERLASSTRLACFIIKTKSDFTFGSLPDPHLLFYYLDPEKDPEYMQKFRHEYAHWSFGRMYGEAPSLFYEGVASYAEKQSGKGQVIPLFPAGGLEADKIPSP
jgi:hypothetical protein